MTNVAPTMGGTSGRRRTEAGGGVVDRRHFPAFVTTASVVLALGLFFQSTVPALRESEELADLEQERLELHQRLVREATGFALRRTALSRDIQTVLVELDRQGIYPAALLEELEARRTAEAARTSGPQ